MKHLIATLSCSVALLAGTVFAYDGDMDVYHEFKEDLSLVRDAYATALNLAMSDANEADQNGWFNSRANGENADWDDLEFEVPSVKYLTVVEIPYGYRLTGTHGAYKVDAKVKVVTRDAEIFYDVSFQKGTNGPGKEIIGEVFKNDRQIFYNNKTPCTREAISCADVFKRGTLGDLRKWDRR